MGCLEHFTIESMGEGPTVNGYAAYYRIGPTQVEDKRSDVVKLLVDAGIPTDRACNVYDALKYVLRAGYKDSYDKDIYKCADFLHRAITGKFMNEVEKR